jgi:hypothetical protein
LRIKINANCFSAVVVEKSVSKCSLKVTVTLVTVYGTELEIHATTKTEKLFQKQLSSLDVEIYALNPLSDVRLPSVMETPDDDESCPAESEIDMIMADDAAKAKAEMLALVVAGLQSRHGERVSLQVDQDQAFPSL